MILRKASPDEASKAYRCIEDARQYHHSLGFMQWPPEYPTIGTVRDDITKGIGFVFEDNGEILGYCCLLLGDEPAYKIIDGAWKTDRPYAVVHRLAFSGSSRGKGLSKKAFLLIKSYCVENSFDAIRIDTHEENQVMQHILIREGFEYCGLITFARGLRLAYEWDI